MRQMAYRVLACGLVFVLAGSGRAEGDEAAAVIDKAIKAHFPKGLNPKNKGLRTKTKGMLHVMGLDLEYAQDVAVQMPNKFKEVMEFTVMGQKVTVTSVYNGKDAWIKYNDTDIPITKEILEEFQDAAYAMSLAQGMFLKDKALKFALVGEVQVNGKPAIGVTVSRVGKKDINFCYDKATGLTAKIELRKRDLMSGQEVTEERIITEYQDVDDRKVAKKVEVKRDGKNLLEAEVVEVKILEKLDDSEFAKP